MCERKFILQGECCISCSDTCDYSENGGFAVWTINSGRINALGIEPIDDIHYCMYGENVHQMNIGEAQHPELKQENGRPRVCLNHLASNNSVTEQNTGLVFTTTPPDRA